MPIVTLPIPDAYESSTRPIAVQIAKSILKDYAAPKNARIVYPGDINKIAQPNSTIADRQGDATNYLPTDSTITITVEEHPIEDRILSTAITRFPDENICIFVDRVLGIYLRPVYTPQETTISFRLHFKDKTQAEQWRNGIKARYSMGRVETLQQISYHYGLPPEMVYMIVEMHRIRETVEPLNETLRGWFDRCFDARLTTVTNQAGDLDNAIIVIPENQVGVLGWFDFTYMPDKQEREESNGYTCGFDYKFQYDKVTDLVLQYPVIIHNQVLPQTIRDNNVPYTLDRISKVAQHSKALFNFMVSQDPKYGSGIEGYALPFFDDWLPGTVPRGVATLLSLLVEVDPLDKHDVVNINDLVDLEFHQAILDFLVVEAPFIAEIGKSIFYFNMFEGLASTGFNKVTLDSSLNVRSVDVMDLRKINHFHFGIITDFTKLNKAALERLRSHPDALRCILDTLMPGAPMPAIMSNGKVSEQDLRRLAQDLLDQRYALADLEARRRMTVGSYRIVTLKNM